MPATNQMSGLDPREFCLSSNCTIRVLWSFRSSSCLARRTWSNFRADWHDVCAWSQERSSSIVLRVSSGVRSGGDAKLVEQFGVRMLKIVVIASVLASLLIRMG